MFEKQVLQSLLKYDNDAKIQHFFERAVSVGEIDTIRRSGKRITSFSVRYKGKTINFYSRGLFFAKAVIVGGLTEKVPAFLFGYFEIRKNRIDEIRRSKQYDELLEIIDEG